MARRKAARTKSPRSASRKVAGSRSGPTSGSSTGRSTGRSKRDTASKTARGAAFTAPRSQRRFTLLIRYFRAQATLILAREHTGPATPRWPRGTREPRLSLSAWESAPLGTSEILLAFHDANGRELGVVAWDGPGVGFIDRLRPDRGLAGGLIRPPRDDRFHEIDVPPGTAFLALYRADVRGARGAHEARDARVGRERRVWELPGVRHVLYIRPLAVWGVPDGHGQLPTIPTRSLRPHWLTDGAESFRGFLDELLDLIRATLRELYEALANVFTTPPPLALQPCGQLEDATLVLGDGTTKNRVNIVITGDGWTWAELEEFHVWAGHAVVSLVGAVPFAGSTTKMNIWVLPTQSKKSGVAGCPHEQSGACSYYRMRGHYPRPNGWATAATFIGPQDPVILTEALETVLPIDHLDLVVLIANCTASGGCALPDLRLVTITGTQAQGESASDAVKAFGDTLIHEVGHAFAGLADEYMGCTASDDGKPYPNLARAAELPPPWYDQLYQAEKHADGTIVYTHDVDDPAYYYLPKFDDANGVQVELLSQAYIEATGLFWGCQFVDLTLELPDQPNYDCANDDFSAWLNPRGRDFYRPSPVCRMRTGGFEFCRVCRKGFETVMGKIFGT